MLINVRLLYKWKNSQLMCCCCCCCCFVDAMSQARRAGIRIYVSDSVEEAKNEGLCYMDQMSDFVFPPAHLILRDRSLTCTKRRGRFVILYVDRPTQTPIRDCPKHTLYSCWANLELCEVLIFGKSFISV